MNKKGFTLAEILFTLAVIGVVATMTMPSLIADIKHRDIKSLVSKAYNTLNTSFDLTCIDEGPADKWADEYAMNKLVERMKIIKYDSLTNTAHLRDGISYRYLVNKAESSMACEDNLTDTASGETIKNVCGRMFVNIKGRDDFSSRQGIETFGFYMTKTGFIPYGGKGTNRTTADLYVTGQVIYDGNFAHMK